MNRDTLYYLEHLDAYEIMETHIMDRVMLEYWGGNLDAGGFFFEASTAYSILVFGGDGYGREANYDYEYENRFYHRKDLEKI